MLPFHGVADRLSQIPSSALSQMEETIVCDRACFESYAYQPQADRGDMMNYHNTILRVCYQLVSLLTQRRKRWGFLCDCEQHQNNTCCFALLCFTFFLFFCFVVKVSSSLLFLMTILMLIVDCEILSHECS